MPLRYDLISPKSMHRSMLGTKISTPVGILIARAFKTCRCSPDSQHMLCETLCVRGCFSVGWASIRSIDSAPGTPKKTPASAEKRQPHPTG
eukprot:2132199-Amphidinium_carterae.1